MNRILLILILSTLTTAIVAQKSLKTVKINKWHKSDDNKIVVSYSIIGSKKDETYDIKVSFLDNKNAVIPSFALGNLKQIKATESNEVIWDVLKDRQDFPEISNVNIVVNNINKMYAPSIPKPKPTIRWFSMGVKGSLGYPVSKGTNAPEFKRFDEFSKDLGFYMAFKNIGIEGSYFLYDSQTDFNTTTLFSQSKSYLAFLNVILGKWGYHKRGCALVLGAGGGQYNKKTSTNQTNWNLVQNKELGLCTKASFIASVGKSFKFDLSYTYHFKFEPNQFVNLGIMIGF